ncbi:MAG: hypothetical protein GF341_04775 [candidate division Zixibacteria bacterium]|nr:hypothetical protein [candidate division Zixibacteria bacterium]
MFTVFPGVALWGNVTKIELTLSSSLRTAMEADPDKVYLFCYTTSPNPFTMYSPYGDDDDVEIRYASVPLAFCAPSSVCEACEGVPVVTVAANGCNNFCDEIGIECAAVYAMGSGPDSCQWRNYIDDGGGAYRRIDVYIWKDAVYDSYRWVVNLHHFDDANNGCYVTGVVSEADPADPAFDGLTPDEFAAFCAGESLTFSGNVERFGKTGGVLDCDDLDGVFTVTPIAAVTI